MPNYPTDWWMPGGGYEQQHRAGTPRDQIAPPAAPPPDAPAAPARVQSYTGYSPRHSMEGFDFSREQNPEKSAKDAFAYFANQAPPPPTNNKAALGVWFRTYIEPGMKQLGHNVTAVEGDKFRFNNWQGDFWVDYGRGAGADGGALAWQADYASGGPSGQAYQQTQQAIMGVPKPNTSNTMPIQSAITRPQQAPGQDLSAYYQYLQQFLNSQDR